MAGPGVVLCVLLIYFTMLIDLFDCLVLFLPGTPEDSIEILLHDLMRVYTCHLSAGEGNPLSHTVSRYRKRNKATEDQTNSILAIVRSRKYPNSIMIFSTILWAGLMRLKPLSNGMEKRSINSEKLPRIRHALCLRWSHFGLCKLLAHQPLFAVLAHFPGVSS